MNKLVTFFAIILFFTLSTTLIINVNAEFSSALVTYVYNGDTLVVVDNLVDNEEREIKLADIKPNDYKSDAIFYLSEITSGKIVVLDISDTYRFDAVGRINAIAYVNHNTTHYLNVNKALLDEKVATIWDEPNDFYPSWSLYIPKNTVPIDTSTHGNWSEVARFSGSCSYAITDSFTCDHVEWRIKYIAYLVPSLFPLGGPTFITIRTFPNGSDADQIDLIYANFSSIYNPRNIVGGTSYIQDNAGNFYMKINPNINVINYTIIIEQNTYSPIPTPEPSPDGLTIGSNVIVPIIVIVALIGSIALFIKFRKKFKQK